MYMKLTNTFTKYVRNKHETSTRPVSPVKCPQLHVYFLSLAYQLNYLLIYIFTAYKFYVHLALAMCRLLIKVVRNKQGVPYLSCTFHIISIVNFLKGQLKGHLFLLKLNVNCAFQLCADLTLHIMVDMLQA